VPGIRIEVTAIRIAGAITTDGGIGIATLETAWGNTVEQPVLCGPSGDLPPAFTRLRLGSLASSDQLSLRRSYGQ
jgi:hypothetical protein